MSATRVMSSTGVPFLHLPRFPSCSVIGRQMARDLIPRMLVVDPLKRITIPEIRKHPWFTSKLPFYLSLPPSTIEKEVSSLEDPDSS